MLLNSIYEYLIHHPKNSWGRKKMKWKKERKQRMKTHTHKSQGILLSSRDFIVWDYWLNINPLSSEAIEPVIDLPSWSGHTAHKWNDLLRNFLFHLFLPFGLIFHLKICLKVKSGVEWNAINGDYVKIYELSTDDDCNLFIVGWSKWRHHSLKMVRTVDVSGRWNLSKNTNSHHQEAI